MQARQAVLYDLEQAPPLELSVIEPNLVLVFGAPQFFERPGLAAWLARAFPSATRIGLSSAGEITSGGVHANSLVVTAIRFDRIGFRVASTKLDGMQDSLEAGRRLALQLRDAPGLRALIVLSQGVSVNGSEVIEGLVSQCGREVTVTGGLAGDNGAFSRTWALCDDLVSADLMLAIGLYGDHVGLSHGSFGGWRSFGPVRRATRASGNILYELDGEPALSIYKRYLGEYADDLPASGLLFPFALLSDDRQETGLIRTLLGVDEGNGSLILAGDVIQGGFLRLMHASTDALIEGAEAAAKSAWEMYHSTGDAIALLISCIGRRLVMGDRVDEEVEAVGSVFGDRCVLTGFYSNGEVSPLHGTSDCRLHNQTMTITYLAET